MVALVQMALSRDLESSFDAHLRFIEEAEAELIVFPECSLVGYDPKDFGYLKSERYQKEVGKKLELLDSKCRVKNKRALVGTVLVEEGGFFNCSVLLGGNDAGDNIYRKRSLTEAEALFFTPGERGLIFEFNGQKFGVLICRDQSNLEYFSTYSDQGVSTVIIQAAHYYDPLESLWKKIKNVAIPVSRAADFKMNVYKVNAVGMLNGYLSLGGTAAVFAPGRVYEILDQHSERVLLVPR